MSENGVREALDALVRRFPGLHVQDLAREAGVSKQLANYHLRHLVAEGRLREIREGSHCRFFAKDEATFTKAERELIVLLRQPALLRIILFLLEHEAAPHVDITRAVGLAKATVSYHLTRLQDAGIVRHTDAGVYGLVQPQRVRDALTNWNVPETASDRLSDVWGRFYR